MGWYRKRKPKNKCHIKMWQIDIENRHGKCGWWGWCYGNQTVIDLKQIAIEWVLLNVFPLNVIATKIFGAITHCSIKKELILN